MPDYSIEDYVMQDSAHFGLIAAPEAYLRSRFDYRIVQSYPIVLCVNKDNPLNMKKSVSFSDLVSENFLMLDRKSIFYSTVMEKAAENGFNPKIAFESSDVTQLCNLTDSGKGIVVGTYSSAFGVLYPNIRTIPFNESDMRVCIAFICRDYNKLGKDEKMFIDYITRFGTA